MGKKTAGTLYDSIKNVSVLVSWEEKREVHSLCVGDCLDSDRDRLRAVVFVPIRSVTVTIRSVTIPMRSVTVLMRSVTVPVQPVTVAIRSVMIHLARRGFQDYVVCCLLPPT